MSDERFIPFLRSEVDAACLEACAPAERAAAGEVHRLLAGIMHQRYRPRLRAVEQDYFLLHPPEYAREDEPAPAAQRDAARRRLEDHLTELASAAGYTRISDAELDHAFRSHALLRVRMAIDSDAIAKSLMFRRGETVATARVSAWYGLRKKTIQFTRYPRMLVYVAFRDTGGDDGGRAHRWYHRFVPGRRSVPDRADAAAGKTVVKLFEDVPRDDMEMLFPRVKPRMRLLDKLMIAVPALVSGVVLLSTKLISAFVLLMLLFAFWVGLRDTPVELNKAAAVTVGAALIALGSYVMRQYRKFSRRKLQFMNVLNENLYYRNLDNDAGVFYRLLSAAEDADFKQALLGYHALRIAGRPLGERELAEHVEGWPALQRDKEFRFGARDVLTVLDELGIVRWVAGEVAGEHVWEAAGLDVACERLRCMWGRAAE